MAAVVLAVTIVNFIWMPGEFLRADPGAWREEARSLLLRGELSVPADYAKSFGEPGQYYVLNGSNGRYYSKYGLGNVLFVLPPMWLQKALGYDISAPGGLPSLLLFNLWYVAWSAILAALLFSLSAHYSNRIAHRVLYVLAVMYATFLWYYERAQSSELPQTLLFTGLFMALVPFLRTLSERGGRSVDRRAAACLAVVWLLAALLVFTRVLYGLLLPLVVCLAAYEIVRGRSWRELRSCRPALIAALLVPPLLIVALVALVNQVKFGAPWLTGYHQWHAETHWPVGRLADGLWGFLFSPRFSIFLYFPVLAFALLGLKPFAARYRIEVVALLGTFAVFLLFLSKLPSWAGEWTYGPRYLLFILPVLSLPFLAFADGIRQRIQAWPARAWALAALVACGYSAYLQAQVNRLPFFMYYWARHGGTSSPELVAYFYERHIGTIADDLVRHRGNLEGAPFFPELKRHASPEALREYKEVIGSMVERGNLYWTIPPEARRSLQFPMR